MNKRHSNLLSWRFRLFILIRRRLTQWSVVWVVAVMISLGWWQLRVHRVNAADERVTLMETRYSPLIQMQAENRQIRQQLADMHSHESLLTRLDDEQVPYRLLSLVSMQVRERDGAVRINSFKLSRTDSPEATPEPNNRNQKPHEEIATPSQLTIRGIAMDNLAVSLFVAGLRDTNVFESVDLKASVGARVDDQRAHSFVIQCGF